MQTLGTVTQSLLYSYDLPYWLAYRTTLKYLLPLTESIGCLDTVQTGFHFSSWLRAQWVFSGNGIYSHYGMYAVEEAPASKDYTFFVKHYPFGCGLLTRVQRSVINPFAHLLGCLRLIYKDFKAIIFGS